MIIVDCCLVPLPLQAFDVAKKRLEQNDSSLVLVGGADSVLGAELASIFTRVHTLSSNITLPAFDSNSDGLSQG